MLVKQNLIVEGVYAAWEAQDIAGVSEALHPEATYTIHLPADAWPLTGRVRGKGKIITLLSEILHDFQVLEYCPLKIAAVDDFLISRAAIQYGHRATGLTYESTIRNIWHFEGEQIRSFAVFHDAARLRAFYQMVSRASVDA